LSSITERHTKIYGKKPDGVFKAPGRVNLIGEHTDYNEGFVLPTPINRHLKISANTRKDQKIIIHALDFEDKSEYNLQEISYDEKHLWANYILGVIYSLQKRGHDLTGVDLCVSGDIPIGAGLSSSAALETASVRCLNQLYNLDLDPVEVAYIGKECENDFVGVQSGIMDQFVSSLGEYGKALFIDCRTNEHSLHILRSDVSIAIVNTMMNRELATSEYNIRHSQCIEAVNQIKKKHPEVAALRDVTEKMLINFWDELPEQLSRRVRHVVTENKRVLDSLLYLDRGDVDSFGELMYDSHDSLRYDYEVSSKHLDILVDSTMDLDGVLGARMTGAGFGGCSVNLVEAEYIDDFCETISDRYFRRTAKKCEIYLA
jgi:galactokinase